MVDRDVDRRAAEPVGLHLLGHLCRYYASHQCMKRRYALNQPRVVHERLVAPAIR